MTLQTDVRPARPGWGGGAYHNIPAFSSKSTGIKMTIYGHFFLYNLYSFVWIQYSRLAYTVFAFDPNNSVIKSCKVLWELN